MRLGATTRLNNEPNDAKPRIVAPPVNMASRLNSSFDSVPETAGASIVKLNSENPSPLHARTVHTSSVTPEPNIYGDMS